MSAGGARRPRRLPLPRRRPHPRRGARRCCARPSPGRAERERAPARARAIPPTRRRPGWLGYDDEKLVRLCREAVADGFTQIKLKVGADLDDDRRRLRLPREAVGPDVRIAIDANQAWGVDEAIEWMQPLRAVRPVLDRGAHRAGRRARPRRDPRGGRADQGRHRRARAQPGHVQAAAAGRAPSTSCRSTPAGSAGVNENIAILLLAAKFGVPVCPHAGGVGLCEMVQHLAMFDYVAVSGTLGGPGHRVRRPPARALRRTRS